MKKTIKRPDGTEEVVEGTAEEIAEYERKLREGPKPSKKKPVLHGAAVDDVPLSASEEMLIRMSRMGFLKNAEPEKVPVLIPQYVPYRLLETGVGSPPCSFCGQYNCNQLHIWCADQTTTGTSLTIGDGLLSSDGVWVTPSS